MPLHQTPLYRHRVAVFAASTALAMAAMLAHARLTDGRAGATQATLGTAQAAAAVTADVPAARWCEAPDASRDAGADR